jgi:hypothetical protein
MAHGYIVTHELLVIQHTAWKPLFNCRLIFAYMWFA